MGMGLLLGGGGGGLLFVYTRGVPVVIHYSIAIWKLLPDHTSINYTNTFVQPPISQKAEFQRSAAPSAS